MCVRLYGTVGTIHYKDDKLQVPKEKKSTKMKQITEKLDKLGKKKKETKT